MSKAATESPWGMMSAESNLSGSAKKIKEWREIWMEYANLEKERTDRRESVRQRVVKELLGMHRLSQREPVSQGALSVRKEQCLKSVLKA